MEAKFVLSTLNPEGEVVAPPNVNNRAYITKDLTVYQNLPIVTGTGLESGTLVQFPLRDPYSIFLADAIPAGHNDTPNLMTCTQPLLAPRTDSGQQVKVSPDLSTTMSFIRPINSVISMKSATTSTTSAALSGVIAGSAPVDIRDMKDFEPTTLAQYSATKKDGFVGIPIWEGAVLLQGPDVPVNYSQPIEDLALNRYPAGVETFTFNIPDVSDASGIFVSPYFTTSNTVFTNQFTCGKLSWFCSLGLRFRAPLNAAWGGGYVQAFVFNAYIDATGAPKIDNTNIAIYIPPFQTGAGTIAVETGPLVYGRGLTSDPKVNGIPVAIGMTFQGTLWGATTFPVEFIAYNLYREGDLGPMRCATWTGLGVGQTLQIRGRVNVQGVVSGNVVPYVSTAGFRQACRLDVLAMLAQAYNGDSPWFRRVYPGSAYAALLAKLSGGVSTTELIDSMELPPASKHTASASGLFSSLGHLIGSAVLGPVGGAVLGGLGSLGDHVAGTGGGAHSAGMLAGGSRGFYSAGMLASGRYQHGSSDFSSESPPNDVHYPKFLAIFLSDLRNYDEAFEESDVKEFLAEWGVQTYWPFINLFIPGDRPSAFTGLTALDELMLSELQEAGKALFTVFKCLGVRLLDWECQGTVQKILLFGALSQVYPPETVRRVVRGIHSYTAADYFPWTVPMVYLLPTERVVYIKLIQSLGDVFSPNAYNEGRDTLKLQGDLVRYWGSWLAVNGSVSMFDIPTRPRRPYLGRAGHLRDRAPEMNAGDE